MSDANQQFMEVIKKMMFDQFLLGVLIGAVASAIIFMLFTSWIVTKKREAPADAEAESK